MDATEPQMGSPPIPGPSERTAGHLRALSDSATYAAAVQIALQRASEAVESDLCVYVDGELTESASSEAALVVPVRGRLRGHLVLARTGREFDPTEHERKPRDRPGPQPLPSRPRSRPARAPRPAGRARRRPPQGRDPDLLPPQGRPPNGACRRRRGPGPLVPSRARRPPAQRVPRPGGVRRPHAGADRAGHRALGPRRGRLVALRPPGRALGQPPRRRPGASPTRVSKRPLQPPCPRAACPRQPSGSTSPRTRS